VKNNHENWTLPSKGDTSTALISWFHRILAGFCNSISDFRFFLAVIFPVMLALTQRK
jgi:hypothetical protein